MVSLAFVLFTVSTLATLSNALPKDLPVRHLCGDETFCNIKPPDYPQEEIDRMVLEMLPQLRRMKRDAVVPEIPDAEGNCEYEFLENVSPYTMVNGSNLPVYLAQSKWFTQSFPEIKCKSDEPVDNNLETTCFRDFLSSQDTKTSCKTKKVYTTAVYFVSGKPLIGNATIGIDCACVIES